MTRLHVVQYNHYNQFQVFIKEKSKSNTRLFQEVKWNSFVNVDEESDFLVRIVSFWIMFLWNWQPNYLSYISQALVVWFHWCTLIRKRSPVFIIIMCTGRRMCDLKITCIRMSTSSLTYMCIPTTQTNAGVPSIHILDHVNSTVLIN